ncbi:MAG: hypothetical protein EOP61_18995, partial [Sphingomonadales bacterium]
IQQLKARYFRTMDTRDFAGMREVFCKDARFDCSEGFFYTPLGGDPVGSARSPSAATRSWTGSRAASPASPRSITAIAMR